MIECLIVKAKRADNGKIGIYAISLEHTDDISHWKGLKETDFIECLKVPSLEPITFAQFRDIIYQFKPDQQLLDAITKKAQIEEDLRIINLEIEALENKEKIKNQEKEPLNIELD